MKCYTFFLTLFISSAMFAQRGDTIFLLRKTADTPYAFYHAIYIDTSMQFRSELTNFSFNNYDSATYFDQLTTLQPIKKIALNNIPKKWIALYQLKGKYYLYRPAEFGSHYRFELTDSTTIDFTMEGPEPSRLNKISFVSPTQVIIERTNYWEGNAVNIKMVDTEKGIAVFTYSSTKHNKEGYQILMVDAGKAHLYPIVVNFCETDKQPEFNFDEIDFKALMK